MCHRSGVQTISNRPLFHGGRGILNVERICKRDAYRQSRVNHVHILALGPPRLTLESKPLMSFFDCSSSVSLITQQGSVTTALFFPRLCSSARDYPHFLVHGRCNEYGKSVIFILRGPILKKFHLCLRSQLGSNKICWCSSFCNVTTIFPCSLKYRWEYISNILTCRLVGIIASMIVIRRPLIRLIWVWPRGIHRWAYRRPSTKRKGQMMKPDPEGP